MSGVKSASTAIAASPKRWYSLKWPPVKMRLGQSWRACRPGMPLLTPKARASYDAASTTPPPTAIGLPRSSGCSSCSTEA